MLAQQHWRPELKGSPGPLILKLHAGHYRMKVSKGHKHNKVTTNSVASPHSPSRLQRSFHFPQMTGMAGSTKKTYSPQLIPSGGAGQMYGFRPEMVCLRVSPRVCVVLDCLSWNAECSLFSVSPVWSCSPTLFSCCLHNRLNVWC